MRRSPPCRGLTAFALLDTRSTNRNPPVGALQSMPPGIAVHEKLPTVIGAWAVAPVSHGCPLRPESHTDEFQRLRARAGLPRIKLHGLRNTSVTLMLDRGIPVHIVAAWHGHDPAVALSIYSDAQAGELRAAGASLFA
jgi:hypothetical protein